MFRSDIFACCMRFDRGSSNRRDKQNTFLDHCRHLRRRERRTLGHWGSCCNLIVVNLTACLYKFYKCFFSNFFELFYFKIFLRHTRYTKMPFVVKRCREDSPSLPTRYSTFQIDNCCILSGFAPVSAPDRTCTNLFHGYLPVMDRPWINYLEAILNK